MKGRPMDVGLQLIFATYGWDDLSDTEMYLQETELALMAEELGFDCIWPTEHHFTDYSLCPDNVEFLAYIAGRTERIDLGTAAVILPWNDPLRVAEKIVMLDHLSGGRARFGMGRGLARREFEGFAGTDMSESRGRFDESSLMIVEALETGFIEGDGPFYPQVRKELRPRPRGSFKDRTYAVANSADSIAACAAAGAHIIMFAESKWANRLDSIDRYRSLFEEAHGRPAFAPMTADFTYCHEDEATAKEVGEEALANYLASLLEHYELTGEHLEGMTGYRGYGKQAALLREHGYDRFIEGFLAANAYGTPEQLLQIFRERYEVIGPFELATCFRFGGVDFDAAKDSMRLFATEVMPEVRSWT